MKITEKFLSMGKQARSGIRFTKAVERILIHWIGPYPTQQPADPWNWWENGGDGKGIKASAHFILKDDNVIQSLPLGEIGWHGGDQRNYDGIGIEVIPMNKAGEFSKASVETLRLLIEHIRKEIGKPLPLERHYDGAQKKDCPRYYTPVTGMVGEGGRVENPPGGEQRWENLKLFLNGRE